MAQATDRSESLDPGVASGDLGSPGNRDGDQEEGGAGPGQVGDARRSERLFRRDALDASRARDDIDSLISLSSPAQWALLVVFLAGCVAAIVWVMFGDAPRVVGGVGAFVPESGIRMVEAPVAGWVERIDVETDQVVREGDVLAVIRTESVTGEFDEVRATVGGQVAGVLVWPGDVVMPGDGVVRIIGAGPLKVSLYVDAGSALDIEPGMRVELSPAGVAAAEWGRVLGRVSSVSTLPVSEAEIGLSVGANEGLAGQIVAAGPMVEVTVLPEQADTPSGFRWSRGVGPDVVIGPGTAVSGSVITEEGSPLDRVR